MSPIPTSNHQKCDRSTPEKKRRKTKKEMTASSSSFILFTTLMLATIIMILTSNTANSEIYVSVPNLNEYAESSTLIVTLSGSDILVDEIYDIEMIFEGVEIRPESQYMSLMRVEMNMGTEDYVNSFNNITIPFTTNNKITFTDISFPPRVKPEWFWVNSIVGYIHAKPTNNKGGLITVNIIHKKAQKSESSGPTPIELLKVAGEKLLVTRQDNIQPETQYHYDTFSVTITKPNQEMRGSLEFFTITDMTPFNGGSMGLINQKTRATGCTINGEVVDARISPFEEQPGLTMTGKIVDQLLVKYPNEWIWKCTNVGIFRPRLKIDEEHLFYVIGVPSDDETNQTWSLDQWVF